VSGVRVTRRTLLVGAAAGAAGLRLACASTGGVRGTAGDAPGSVRMDAWLTITPEGTIVLSSDKVEMGQGTFTGMATLVAEELGVEPRSIEVRHADVEPEFQNPLQVTGGSTSLATRWEPLRTAAATARELLRAAGARRLGVAPDAVTVADGRVSHAATGASFGYGELAADAARLPIPDEVPLTPPERYRFIGRAAPRVDAEPKVTGRAMYGIDATAPDVLHAVVRHAPRAGAELESFDASAALADPSVEQVMQISTGVAVVAKSYWHARRAAEQVQVTWTAGPYAGMTTETIRAAHRERLSNGGTRTDRDDGNASRALAGASRTLEAEYYAPYQAHATMEPASCTIELREGGADVWVSTQAPDVAQDVAAAGLGLRRAQVRVRAQLLGGGFGRRVYPDVVAEAAEIARMLGRSVKLLWSREDDMARDFYRPATTHRIRGGLDAAGRIVAWHHRFVAPSILADMIPGVVGALGPQWARGAVRALGRGFASVGPRILGPTASEGAASLPYAIENVAVESVLWESPLRVGIWRSVDHSHQAFVVESFLDELAHAAGVDPAEMRLRLLAGAPRQRGVLELALEHAKWGQPRDGRSQGLAVHASFGTAVAQVAEVSVSGGELRVHRVVCAVDCGTAVNPDIVAAQMESGILFGLTAAQKSEITVQDGAAEQRSFDRYALLRMQEAPEIEVHIVPSQAPPTGVGEPGTPPIAPAVANAVFRATGQRLRELPLRLPA
jgi:CO/xanthine dehydrogenase Mo-binding subunit